MTVRVFSSARITLDEGTLDTFRTNGFLGGAWTAVCVFKRSGSTGDGTQFMFSASSSGSLRFGLSYSTASALQVTVGGNSRTFGASFTISNATWYVFAVRKAAGTATPSAKLWNAGTGAVVADWTNGSGTLDDDTNLWDELQIGNRVNDFPLNGKMGGVALFSSDVGTTVGDTFGTGLQEWLDASPVGMWTLTQAATTDPVLDEVGDADETAITATSVDTGDDPASFDLTLGGGGDATVTPAVIACTTSVPRPAVNTSAGPAAVTTTSAVPRAAVNTAAGPSVTAATVTVPRPAVNVAAGPAAIAVTVALARPAVNVAAGPAVFTATVTLPTPTVGVAGNATVTPAAIACTVAVPRAAVNTAAGPSVVAAAVTLPAAGVNVAAGPAVVPVTVELPRPAVGSTVFPATVAATVTIPRPAANVGASPATVAVTVALPTPTIGGVTAKGDSTDTVVATVASAAAVTATHTSSTTVTATYTSTPGVS